MNLPKAVSPPLATPRSPEPFSRRKSLLVLATLGSLPLLQACFPLAVGTVGLGAVMISDRRTSGTYVEDEGIEWRTRNRLRERFGNSIYVNPTSYNRNLLLTGEAPNESVRAEIGRIAEQVENVRGIVNEVRVGELSTLSSRASDALVTSRVKGRFVDDTRFGANHVKVVTEAGTVFLMGMVTRNEAEMATEIARTTAGVMKVVRVFEFISDDEARRLDGPSRSEN